MKSSVIFKFLLIITVLSFSSCQEKSVEKEKKTKAGISEFLGHWTIDIEGGQVGWLDVRQEDGYLDADLLWGGGSVLPVSYIYLNENVLNLGRNIRNVVRKKGADGVEIRTHMIPAWVEVEKEGEKIVGYLLSPKSNGTGLDSFSIVGTKLPEVPPCAQYVSCKIWGSHYFVKR